MAFTPGQPPVMGNPNFPQPIPPQINPVAAPMPLPHQMPLNQMSSLQQANATQPNMIPCVSPQQQFNPQPENPDPPTTYFQHMKPEHVQAMGLESMGKTWKEALKEEFSSPYFAKRLAPFVTAERKNGDVYPPPEDVFNWTKHCRIFEVKVVIVGQDPYPGTITKREGRLCKANGYAFSIRSPGRADGSLRNIFTVLENDHPEFEVPRHGNLASWSLEGVILLNAVLTVRAGKAGSHKHKGWETFTDAVIEGISSRSKRVVFMLWGELAQKKRVWIDEDKHLVLTSSHPSARSVDSTDEPFSECGHFSKANEFLYKHKKGSIDWNILNK